MERDGQRHGRLPESGIPERGVQGAGGQVTARSLRVMSRLGRRTSFDRPGSVDMPITPMLDMTFQLLFFFIVNYHPPINEGEINYNLPAREDVQMKEPIEK